MPSVEPSKNLAELVEQMPLAKGSWTVLHRSETEKKDVPLLRFSIDVDVEPGSKQTSVPSLSTLPERATDRARVLHALVRAGARHPGVRLSALAELHKQVIRESHVELFADLCSLTHGLLQTAVRSLGSRVARVVVSSSSVDVMAEYQGRVTKKDRESFLRQAEMRRALALLDEIRKEVPVHVHQLAPGAARYFRRTGADGPGTSPSSGTAEVVEHRDEPWTYVSEDRQMMAAYWNYLSADNPRIPVRFLTADHHLARVCVAEKAPILFGRDPSMVLGENAELVELLWFDPFALRLRSVTAHEMLREIALVYGSLHVQSSESAFSLRRDPDGWPDEPQSVRAEAAEIIEEPAAKPSPESKAKSGPARPTPPPARPTPPPLRGRSIKLAFTTLVKVLPTRPAQVIGLERFPAKDEDIRRQLAHVGEATGLFTITEESVEAGGSLPELLDALSAGDYLRVNDIFRRVPWYAQSLADAEENGFARDAGPAGGWALVLGAAYKGPRGLSFGLAKVSDESFEDAVVSAHGAVGRGGQTAALAQVMDMVCENKRLSPIRFEGMLARSLGHGRLARYEGQRASHDERARFSKHPVLVKPKTSSPDSYLREMNPGAGLLIGGTMCRSLVRLEGGAE